MQRRSEMLDWRSDDSLTRSQQHDTQATESDVHVWTLVNVVVFPVSVLLINLVHKLCFCQEEAETMWDASLKRSHCLCELTNQELRCHAVVCPIKFWIKTKRMSSFFFFHNIILFWWMWRLKMREKPNLFLSFLLVFVTNWRFSWYFNFDLNNLNLSSEETSHHQRVKTQEP